MSYRAFLVVLSVFLGSMIAYAAYLKPWEVMLCGNLTGVVLVGITRKLGGEAHGS